MFKNVASQKWVVFAFDTSDGSAKTGDAANITGKISIDHAAAGAITDTNPTEVEDGYYVFDLTQGETNGNHLLILPESSTADIQVIGCPGVVFTDPPNFTALGIESDGDLTKVNTLDGHTAQTGDSFTVIGSAGDGLTALPWNSNWDAEVQSECEDAIDAKMADVKSQADQALVDIHLDHLFAAAYDATSKPGNAAGLLNEMVEDNAGVTRYTAAALSQASGSGATAEEVRIEMDANSTQLAAIVEDTGTTLPGTLSTMDGKLDTIDGIVDDILVDTGTTLPGTLTTIDGIVDDILVDTGTTIPGALTTIDGIVDDILVDTAEIGAAGIGLTAITADTEDIQARLPAALVSGRIAADAVAVSGSTAAADAVEANIGNLDAAVTAVVADTEDIQARIPAALAGGLIRADVVAISGDTDAANNLESYCDGTDNQPVDVKEIDSSTTAAGNLSKSALGIVTGACEGTPTTTVIQTDLAEATDDHYIGRVIVFITGNAAGQGAPITDYTGATGTVTVTAALTTAPVATDEFVIV